MKKIVSFCLALCATTALWAGSFTQAAFSIADGKQIYFSPGNLQCSGTSSFEYVWSFSENQYDMLGTANVSGDALADKVDLFGWSTTGIATWGISTFQNNDYYSGDFVDWGTNAINANEANTYRTLTDTEWKYLLENRTDATKKMGVARINLNSDGSQYVNGLILLPDSWTGQEGVTFKSGLGHGYDEAAYANQQIFTLAQWQKLEAAGAVFLPASGWRIGTGFSEQQVNGYYWSATLSSTNSAYYLYFNAGQTSVIDNFRYTGQMVRLVCEIPVEKYAINIASDIENGVLAADKTTAAEGETVTLTVTPASHCVLKSISVLQGETEIALTAVDGASNQYTFTMPAGDVAVNVEFEKIAPAAFSIADGKYIYFSLGNLQCTLSATDTTWSFAENQYDMIGWDNTIGPALAEKIDLFGWSGSTGSAKWGVSISTNPLDYAGDFADWGANTIGISAPNTYRTLTKNEWDYLLITRTNASEKQGVARINITEDGAQAANGLILLPDNWVCPDGIAFTNDGTDYSANTFTLAQWQKLEAAGAVFLPAAGHRMSVGMADVQSTGSYWTATTLSKNYPHCMAFGTDTKANANAANVCMSGYAVRLVQDLHVVSIAAAENGTVAIDKLGAIEGETVTLTITPAEGYEVESITVTYGDGQTVEVKDNKFTMPAGDVTITVVFKESGTAIGTVEMLDLRTENGSVIYDGEFQIFDLLGRNVTRLNGSLNGVYIVKVGDKAQKVVVK